MIQLFSFVPKVAVFISRAPCINSKCSKGAGVHLLFALETVVGKNEVNKTHQHMFSAVGVSFIFRRGHFQSKPYHNVYIQYERPVSIDIHGNRYVI